MNKSIYSVLFILIFTSSLFATWALISMEDLLEDTELVVIGTLHSAEEDQEGIGKGYIRVDQVVTRNSVEGIPTTSGRSLSEGDNLKVKWADNWACAVGMHMGRQGEQGIWLLQIEEDGSVTAGYPGRFRKLDDLDKVRRLMGREKPKTVQAVEIEDVASEVEQVQFMAMSVDVTPFREYSPFRAALVLLFMTGLYWVLYRSRFRIR